MYKGKTSVKIEKKIASVSRNLEDGGKKKRIKGIIIYGMNFATIRRDTWESVVPTIRAGVFAGTRFLCCAVFGHLCVRQPLKGGACSTACDTGSAGSELRERHSNQRFLLPLFSLGMFRGTNQENGYHCKRGQFARTSFNLFLSHPTTS